MAKGFSPALVTLLFAAVACCTPVLSGRDDSGNGTSSAASATASSSAGSTASSTSAAASASPTVPYASNNPNPILWLPDSDVMPQPIRGSLGATDIGPHNIPIELQNADTQAPPTTDNGDVPNAKWPMSLSPQRLVSGGWVREETTEELPIATELAGAQIRLEVGAIRELHWHNVAEWSYVMAGYVQISAVDQDGKNYLGTAGPGDVWYFPPGIPHSLQATNQSADGAEFMLIFDDGNFPGGDTFLLTGKFTAHHWLPHIPKEVLAKNFQADISAFNNIPSRALYIFPADPPTTSQVPDDPQGQIPNPFVFPFSQVPVTQLGGGSIKIVDSTTFKASVSIAAAEVVVEPGAMRELHWHPNADEWDYILEGNARMGLFAAQSNAKTWDFEAGDVAYIPVSWGHYVENVGNTTLRYLEIFKSSQYRDVSLQQWLALTPDAVVMANTGLSEETIATFKAAKQFVIGPAQPSSS